MVAGFVVVREVARTHDNSAFALPLRCCSGDKCKVEHAAFVVIASVGILRVVKPVGVDQVNWFNPFPDVVLKHGVESVVAFASAKDIVKVVITDGNVNFEFSNSFNHAIEEKQTAEQEALRATNILRRMKVEADQKIETARGAAESVKLQAMAEAEAIAVKAKAEAEAQRILAEVVNKDVITLRAIEMGRNAA